jgi:hypothetical protein
VSTAGYLTSSLETVHHQRDVCKFNSGLCGAMLSAERAALSDEQDDCSMSSVPHSCELWPWSSDTIVRTSVACASRVRDPVSSSAC